MKAGRGQRLGRARPARLGATAARRRVAVLLSWRERQRAGRGEDSVRAQVEGRQRRGEAARRQRGSEAAAAAQRGSERTRAQVPARARRAERGESAGKRERGERKRVERGRKSQQFDLVQT